MSRLTPAVLLLPAWLAAAVGFAFLGALPASGQLDKVEEEAERSLQEGVEAQGRIDQVAEERAELVARYRAALNEADGLRRYNAQLKELILDRERGLRAIAQAHNQFENTKRTFPPLLDDMIEALDQFIRLDLPFQRQARLSRIEDLRNLMVQRDVPLSEKYRQVLDAYHEERRYGQTVETYSGEIQEGERLIPVDFLRVGRLGLYVQSRDRRISRTYDLATRSWIEVPGRFRRQITSAIAMARTERPHDLLTLPLTAARIKQAANPGQPQ